MVPVPARQPSADPSGGTKLALVANGQLVIRQVSFMGPAGFFISL